MTVLSVDSRFASSVDQAVTYPLNLIHQQTYAATLRAYKERLDAEASRIFETDSSHIPIQDFDPVTKLFSRTIVHSLDELRAHHGVRACSTGPNDGLVFEKADPPCRAVFLHAPDSRSKLQVSRDVMLDLFSFNQVMPGYLDFVFLFGEKIGPNDLKFSAFREQTSLKSSGVNLGDLRRSGQNYELCYNLKTVNRKDIPAYADLEMVARIEWSIRQAGVFHKLDVTLGTTLWTFTKGSLDLEQRFQEVTGRDGRLEDRSFDNPVAAFRSSLAVHAMMIHWATESWRWYLQWLDAEIERETGQLTSESRGASKSRFYQTHDLQRIQKLSDQVSEAILALDGNMDVIRALRDFYSELVRDQDLTIRTECQGYVTAFVKQTRNADYDLKLQCSRAKALAYLAAERRNLLLQYMNAQTAEKQMELTVSSYHVSVSAQNEAVLVRIITVATLFFLPATFVSTFFSTPIVNFATQSNTGGDTESTLALYRWLEISIPLTVVTLGFAGCAYIWELRRRDERQVEEYHRLRDSKYGV